MDRLAQSEAEAYYDNNNIQQNEIHRLQTTFMGALYDVQVVTPE